MLTAEKNVGTKDGDQKMKLKENKIKFTQKRLQEVYAEEYQEVVAERLRKYFKDGGTIDEGFLDKIKGGAKGFMQGYGKLIKNYGDFVADLYGYSGEEEIPDEPGEIGKKKLRISSKELKSIKK